MKIRLMPAGMFYDFDNGLTLSVQYGPLSYANCEAKTENGVDYRVISDVDIAVLKTDSSEMVKINRYDEGYPAVAYFPVKLLPQVMMMVQQSRIKELGNLIHNWMNGNYDDTSLTKADVEEASDAIARG